MRTTPELWFDILRVGQEEVQLAILSLPTHELGTPLFLLPTKELGRQKTLWLLEHKYLFPSEATDFQAQIQNSSLPESCPTLHITERYEEEIWGIPTENAAYPT